MSASHLLHQPAEPETLIMADTLPLHHRTPTTTVIGPEPLLTRLINRLEAATSRLEDIASTAFENGDGAASKGLPSSSSAPELPGVAASKSAPPTAQPTPAPTPAVSLPATLSDMDTLISDDVSNFVSAAEALGDSNITEQVCTFEKHTIGPWLTTLLGARSLTRLCRSAQVLARLDRGQEARPIFTCFPGAHQGSFGRNGIRQ